MYLYAEPIKNDIYRYEVSGESEDSFFLDLGDEGFFVIEKATKSADGNYSVPDYYVCCWRQQPL